MDEHICPWWFAYTFDNPDLDDQELVAEMSKAS